MPENRQLILFDYSQLPTDVTEFVQRRTLEIRAFHKRTAESIIQIGLRLIEVKDSLGHGHFMNWLDTEFGWSDQTARRYMWTAEKFNKLLNLDHYDTSAMYLLAAPSTPVAVLEIAQALTIEGEYISHARAEQLLRDHQQAEEQESFPDETDDDSIDEQEIDEEPARSTCSECGEILGSEAWHCLSCHCHWPMNINRCPSCGMPYAAGAQANIAKLLRDVAPDLLEDVRTGEKSLTQARRELVKRQAAAPPPIPTDKYRVIYADPPWSYGNTQPDYHPEQRDHYPVMSMQEICALPIQDLAEDNAVLFLWVTTPILEDSFQVVKAWGFKYKALFVWDKIKHNMGHYNSVRCELLLICVRGSCQPDVQKLFDNVQSIERTEHSEKPEQFREIIDTIYPHGKRIELFARTQVPNWDRWGNE